MKDKPDPLKPSAQLLIKIGSLIVHLEEANSSDGHYLDRSAIEGLDNDPEVVEWKQQMYDLALLPVKRK